MVLCEEIPYEQLFVEEFDASVVEFDEEEEVAVEKIKDEAYLNEVFNPDFTMPKAVEELVIYMKEKGIYVDVDSIRSLFAGFASSRLLLLNADDKELLVKFIQLLSRYFNCENVEIDYRELSEQGGDVINTTEGITAIAESLINEEKSNDGIRIMTVKNIVSNQVKSCLQQVIRYIEQPEKELTFSILKDGKSYPFANNLWFVLTLADEEKVVDIPKYILESANVLDLMMRPMEEDSKNKNKKSKKQVSKIY